MRTIEPILLTGDYDWDDSLLTTEEYSERLEAVRAVLAEKGCAGLVLEGDGEDHAALVYLTGYTPKLGRPGIALIPAEADGAIKLFFPGGPPMTPAARRQTWVSDLSAARDTRTIITDWLETVPAGKPIALAGSSVMGTGFAKAFAAAAGPSRGVVRLDQRLDQMRRKKSPREREVVRRGVLILAATVDAFTAAIAAGGGTRSAAVAAEKVAHRLRAQDVRVLASAEPAGMPWPFDRTDDPKPTTVLAHVAVRFAGYWSEGFITLGQRTEAADTAERTLAALVDGIKAGASVGGLAKATAERIVPYRLHPYMEGSFGYGTGLFPEEAPRVAFGVEDTFKPGDVLALRVGLDGTGNDNGFASAMVELTDDGPVTLWSSAKKA